MDRIVPAGCKVHKGIFYFFSPHAAREWAIENGWPVEGVRQFGLGHAVQAGPSGVYAGLENPVPKLWQGRTF